MPNSQVGIQPMAWYWRCLCVVCMLWCYRVTRCTSLCSSSSSREISWRIGWRRSVKGNSSLFPLNNICLSVACWVTDKCICSNLQVSGYAVPLPWDTTREKGNGCRSQHSYWWSPNGERDTRTHPQTKNTDKQMMSFKLAGRKRTSVSICLCVCMLCVCICKHYPRLLFLCMRAECWYTQLPALFMPVYISLPVWKILSLHGHRLWLFISAYKQSAAPNQKAYAVSRLTKYPRQSSCRDKMQKWKRNINTIDQTRQSSSERRAEAGQSDNLVSAILYLAWLNFVREIRGLVC